MIKLKDIGKFDTIPELAQHIYEGNIAALNSALAAGWDIEQGIELSRYITCSPLDIAIIAEQLEVVKLLCEHGANLNAAGSPAFLTAVRYCGADIVRYVAANGAKLDAINNVKSGAYEQAYYGNKANIPLIAELGLDITKHGGKTLRKAVDKHDLKTIDYLLEHGVDINFNEPDMVYPYKATPLTVAARNGNLKMVKYLVERGADVTLTEKDGERAYTIAVSSKHTEMADYLKAIEPPAFHHLENKLQALKSYKLPKDMIAFLCGDRLRLELPANEYEIYYVEFFSITDVIEMKVGRQKLLRLTSAVDNYSDILIVWNPKKKCIGYYDVEHQVYADVCSFAEFLLQPEVHLANIIEGEWLVD
ncbi:ankyrin repeat domain-containing protein [Paenibacillus sp. ACRRX]|uniref:ankyrin repeat domain-containing protein n=1 Tax=unclassified Paenibacillus TaxID=185978 RepID=UPI001EF5ED6D|nr:ankyrin repeat domain-containing protein [Paenibacillus sp. UMB4589-SE434]MCG7405936.1 ankyrin repeat domain-containing protein [Paenibacillus sp. ACRRX]MDK8182390.1 ankyrin repeat domain-containing protein [Paenibacillus sp. UMB4589-SE434]